MDEFLQNLWNGQWLALGKKLCIGLHFEVDSSADKRIFFAFFNIAKVLFIYAMCPVWAELPGCKNGPTTFPGWRS